MYWIDRERRFANQVAHGLVTALGLGIHRRPGAGWLRAHRVWSHGRVGDCRRLGPLRLWRADRGASRRMHFPRGGCFRALGNQLGRGDGALPSAARDELEALAASELEVAPELIRWRGGRSSA